MTKEEARKKLKMILEEATAYEDAVCYVTSDDAEALDMAIKALEQQSCDDCISRQAAEAIFRNAKKSLYEQSRKGKIEYKEFQIREMMLLNAEQFIHLLPSAEPERKTGKWEYIQYDGDPKIGNWHCSNCRLIVTLGFEGKPYYHYCPSCGAKMEVDNG